jgi:DNA processing protein
MVDTAERAAWLRLALTAGVGPRTARELLGRFGLPQAIFDASAGALRAVVAEPLAQTLAAPAAPALAGAIDATLAWLAANPAHALLTLADADYPAPLLTTGDPPPVLFAIGDLALLKLPALAIVGARSATTQGVATAQSFAHALAQAGLVIVSGLALGIDSAAHRGALRAHADGAVASTIAVVGTGVDVVYPRSNAAVTEQVRRHGLVLSEFPLGAPPLAHHFPRRNRLIAGLARGVLVVEAALRSGSLITARLAAESGREVFAIPGSIHSPLARGCHRLIRDGAKLVEQAGDILEELRLPAAATAAALAPPAEAPPHPELLAALGEDPVDLDTLAVRTGLDAGTVAAALLELELAQHVERLPGNRYQRLRSGLVLSNPEMSLNEGR